MLNRHDIPYAHWSLKVGRIDRDAGLLPDVHGEVVVAIDDVHQAIANLILTPKRSVPGNPEKGCDLSPYIDRHEAEAVPAITQEIWDALAIWETRIVVSNVIVLQATFARFVARINWRPIQSVLDDLNLQVTEVDLV